MPQHDDAIKQPKNLSPRVQWLRDYFFQGTNRAWNNENNVFTTGDKWDRCYDELTYYIVPETKSFFQPFTTGYVAAGKILPGEAVAKDFYKRSIVERKALYEKEVIVNQMPKEILPGDLLCGARFNAIYSMGLNKKESKEREKLIQKTRKEAVFLIEHGYGNAGATSGHLVPDYAKIVRSGFKAVYEDLQSKYNALSEADKNGKKGAQLRAMMTACEIPRDLAAKYREECLKRAAEEKDEKRKKELEVMAANLAVVPWNGAQDFYQAIQALWLTHMLVMFDEKYPGPGVSFGRIDQYLLPYYEKSVSDGMDRDFMKEILGCFWVHCNTAYDAQIRVGANQGITAGFGQLFNLSGMGKGGVDMTNDLTYLLLDVIDDMSPILEPKPNVRLHKNTPEKLLDRVVDMVSTSQGAPFLLDFDERSMAGMMREAKKAGVSDLINEDNVCEYVSVGCLENTMPGNDRSGTVDVNVNLLKAMELTYGNGKDFMPFFDPMSGKWSEQVQVSEQTGTLAELDTFDKFYAAVKKQLQYVIKRMVKHYDNTESIRAKFNPTPYLSLLVNGCAEKAKDITEGGAQLGFVTIEGVTFATTVDSLLAVKYLVYDKKICSLEELVNALKADWKGYEKLQAQAQNRAPKYGRDDDQADALAKDFMEFWADETWKYKTTDTDRRFRPGMLSWNYWIGSGYILKASADGRNENKFLSNAICPSNGADINGPTSNSNSVGKALGGKAEKGDYGQYLNCLPNGASHTITFNTSVVKDPTHKEKFKSFLRGYIENGGTALQINILDPSVLRDAQAHPSEYRHLLVRVTGYNAYFTSIGRELQNEIIAREDHKGF
ncbi:MAG: hypothetical protein IJ735_04265 [Clostridia bacterium]|nr:hypothetical protein [Clostridia bacterium]